MIDRRRTPRYVLAAPLRGEAMPMEDVTIDEYTRDRLVVTTRTGHRADDELMVHVTTARGVESRRGRVVSSSPASVSGRLCYRVELQLCDRDGADTDQRPGARIFAR
jgi:hypothetical protein